MTIARKALVWGLFAAGGTLTSFVFPSLIALFLLIASGNTPVGLEYGQIHAFAASWMGKASLFGVIFLALWHAAHRLRVAAHDLGLRVDGLVASVLYLVAALGSALAVYYLVLI